MKRLTPLLFTATLSLAACRERNRDTPAPAVVPTTVQPTPVAPVVPAFNALADAGAPVLMPAPVAVVDAGAPVVAMPAPAVDAGAPTAAAPTPPVDPGSAPRAQRTRTNDPDPVNIPPAVQGLPGVRVHQRRGSTTVNVGGIQINVPSAQ